MANVAVTCRNFPTAYAACNGVRTRDIQPRAVLRAVVTVGAQRFSDMFAFGWRGLLHRFGIGLSAFSFLEQSAVGLRLSDRFDALDGSEKGAATYWYGMALAKIIADAELGIRWLSHVDSMRKSGALTVAPGTNERGDLVGRGTNGDWHVVEAKGRSNPYPAALVSKAKTQSSRVTAINGQPPATTIACISSLFTHPVSVLLDDPPATDQGNGEQWRINVDEFFHQYYHGIIEYLRENGRSRQARVGNAELVTAPLFPLFWNSIKLSTPWRLELGLLAQIYNSPKSAEEAVRELRRDDTGYIGSDGIAIIGRLPE